ncbi:hypothetical protein TrVE_jg1603 [Triparma verrucosa]|uniref:WW domain-containing protein n=1 Tax=Triparma verrucosa TaxID=1606542 RepID=A0A9W7BWE0_9STRA|nr:hypothetical protein TrVE_jg1603 [Triparma verrucosa]
MEYIHCSEFLEPEDVRGGRYWRSSSVSSSFSANEDVWIEHKCEEGGRKGETYYHQPSTGKTVWERPGEGASIKFLKGSKKKTKEKRNDKEEGGGEVVEMTDVGVDIGLGSRTNSVFFATNPMAKKGGEQINAGFRQEGGESEKWEATEDEDGNQYWYDESSGRTTWSDKSQS